MINANVYFEHIRRLVRIVAAAPDIQGIIDAYEQIYRVQKVWEQMADVVRASVPELDDPVVELEILKDIENLLACLDQFRRETGGRSVPLCKSPSLILTEPEAEPVSDVRAHDVGEDHGPETIEPVGKPPVSK